LLSRTSQRWILVCACVGDGFASGLIYGLISGRTPEEALRLGWAHGALLTTYHGDVTMARKEEVEALAKGGSARVQR
jgi:2-dehydro-3-deoxygluconokinase